MKQKFLLHTCCAICGCYIIQQLQKDYEVVAYFYNPNIHLKGEYLKRKEVLENYCRKNEVRFTEGDYCPKKWFEEIRGLEKELEGGQRCKICYKIRLEEAAKKAKELNCDYFGSTLTISPYKKADIINPIGKSAGEKFGIKFFEADWKKEDGFKKANQISKEEHFYRQRYCGCAYSMR